MEERRGRKGHAGEEGREVWSRRWKKKRNAPELTIKRVGRKGADGGSRTGTKEGL